jgi:hypothetical protein
MSSILEYFEALERLKTNKPEVVPLGSKITKDSVALEAGRKKGAIKKGRSVFAALIRDIEEASLQGKKSTLSDKDRIARQKQKVEEYRSLYEAAMAREAMLILRIFNLEKENFHLKSKK